MYKTGIYICVYICVCVCEREELRTLMNELHTKKYVSRMNEEFGPVMRDERRDRSIIFCPFFSSTCTLRNVYAYIYIYIFIHI